MWLIKASVAKPLHYYLHNKADSWHVFSLLLCYRFLFFRLCLFITLACKHAAATQALEPSAPCDEATLRACPLPGKMVEAEGDGSMYLNTSRH